MSKYIELTNNYGKSVYILKDAIIQICEYTPEKMRLTFDGGYIENTIDENCNSYIIINASRLAFNG